MFYFRSLMTLRSVSLPMISLMWHGVTLTLFLKFRYLHEKMFPYLDEKMYLGRWLFPLKTFFLRYLLVIICLGWIELTSNRFHLSHSYMSNLNSREGVKAYPWILSKYLLPVHLFVCPSICLFVRLSPWDHFGDIHKLNLFGKYLVHSLSNTPFC